MKLIFEHLKSGLRPLIDIKKLLISSGRHLILHRIQVQTSGPHGLPVPYLLIKRVLCKIKRRDIVKPLLLHIPVLPQSLDGLLHAKSHSLPFWGLQPFKYLVLDLFHMDAIPVHLDTPQSASVLHLSLQVEHPATSICRDLLCVPVTVIRHDTGKCAGRLLKLVVIPAAVDHLVGGCQSQIIRYPA